MTKRDSIKELLRNTGARATKARVDVLLYLGQQKKPIGIDRLDHHFPSINTATLYRMMNDFVERGLVETYELGHGHVDYELADRPHHHHLVCNACGAIEDVFSCKSTCSFVNSVLKASKSFSSINKQSATFFGTCKQCA